MGWPKESRDMNYPLWTRLYMFVVEVASPKGETLHLVIVEPPFCPFGTCF